MKKLYLTIILTLIATLFLTTPAIRGLMGWLNTPATTRAEIAGKDGDFIVTAPNTVVNLYASLAVNATAGSSMIAVTYPGGPHGLTAGALSSGDLLLIIQMSGATINTSDSASYGQVISLNNAGRYEYVTVNKVEGSMITVNPPCGGLLFDYTANGRVQVIRVPQYSSLTINSGASITAPPWNGVFGGLVAMHVQNSAVINGTIDVSGLGFRGGALSGAGGGRLRTDYVTQQQDFGAEKGEGIAGYQAIYDLLGGRYARGAAANAGGGATSHNSGGGGGANGDNGILWTGQGNMDGNAIGADAWKLDPSYIAAGNKLTVSSGGGRGGYSYADSNANALVHGPGNQEWGGDFHREVGGLGGRPLAQDPTGRLFFGGGGGAGGQNNISGGGGGSAGGLIFILADSVSGSGLLKADGNPGENTRFENRDGAGGGGAGGTIVVAAKALSGVSAQANGGKGGDQNSPLLPNPFESQGPGGGGGGGFIAYSGGTMTTQVLGGINGIHKAIAVQEFPPNGATRGATGLVQNTVGKIPFCQTTTDLSVTKTNNQSFVIPGAPTTYVIEVRNGGPNDAFGVEVKDLMPPGFIQLSKSWTCAATPGSTCAVGNATGDINTTVNVLKDGIVTFNLTATLDPSLTGAVTNTVQLTIPAGAVDSDPINNTASDTDPITPRADLEIAKTNNRSTVTPGQPVTYEIVVVNNGPSNAVGFNLSDTVPAALNVTNVTCAAVGGSCGTNNTSGNSIVYNGASLTAAAGNRITLTITGTLSPSATGTFTNSASIAIPPGAPFADPGPRPNTATDSDPVMQEADLSISKTNNQTTIVPGGAVTYQIEVKNNGPSDAVGFNIVDAVPAAINVTSVTCVATGGSCGTNNTAGNQVSFNGASLQVGAGNSIKLTIVGQVNSAATGTLINTANIVIPPGAGFSDQGPGPNSATDTDQLTPQADLVITKTNNQTAVVPGGPVTYQVEIKNNGPSDAVGFNISDAVPAAISLTNVTCTATGGNCGTNGSSGNAILFTGASLQAGSGNSIVLTIAGQVSAAATGTLANTASIIIPPGAGFNDQGPGPNSATDSDQLTPQSDLEITKTNNRDFVTPGTTITYQIVIKNNGPSNAVGFTFADNVPAALSITNVACTASGGSCGTNKSSGNSIEFTDATLEVGPGKTITLTITGTLSPSVTGTFANTAFIVVPPGAGFADPGPKPNSATDSDPVSLEADLSITKTNNQTTVIPGNDVTYQIEVKNGGPSNASGFTITDGVPAAMSVTSVICTPTGGSCGTNSSAGNLVQFTGASLDAGAGNSLKITIVGKVSTGATGTLINTADIVIPPGAGFIDQGPGPNSATDADQLAPQADLVITKSNGQSTLTAGGDVTYQIEVKNSGPSDAVGFEIVDAVPSSISITSVTCLASGGNCGTNNTSGNQVRYTGVRLQANAGNSIKITIVGKVSASATGTVVNTANIVLPPGVGFNDPGPGANSATDSDQVLSTADLTITKTNNQSTVTPGSSVTYQIEVKNNGPSDAAGFVISDTVPGTISLTNVDCTATGGSCGTNNTAGNQIVFNGASLQAGVGNSIKLTITGTVSTTATGTLVNTAAITIPPGTGLSDPDPGSNSSTDTDQLTPQADLSVSKVATSASVIAGNQITYQIEVVNNGPSHAPNVAVVDTLPAALSSANWTCVATAGSSCTVSNGAGNINTTVSLQLGGKATFTLTATVAPSFAGTLSNMVTATPPSGIEDPQGGNNSATSQTPVSQSADVLITKGASPTVLKAGGDVTFTLTVTNVGPSEASNIEINDPLPSGLEVKSITPSQGTCTGTTTIVCAIGTLGATAPTNTATVTIVVRVPFSFPVGVMTNVATVSASTPDPNTGNNSATRNVTVNPPPGAKINTISVKATSPNFCIGEGKILTFEVTLRNDGDGVQGDNPGPELVAILPVQLNTVSSSCSASSGSCRLSSNQVEWNGELTPGQSLTISYQVRVRLNTPFGTRFCTAFRMNYDTNSDGVNDALTTAESCQVTDCTDTTPCVGPDCPGVGPGIPLTDSKDPVSSDQRPGSILIFPYYTSSSSVSGLHNTKINITNVDPINPVFLHLFFIDGSNCTVADNFICLTANQTTSFLMSDLDPDVNGYLIAVAVDADGFPIKSNTLIGDEFLRLPTGFTANVAAESVAALKDIPKTQSSIATLKLDGLDYSQLGRTLAVDNIPSDANGNNTLLIVDAIGGDLASSAASIGSLFGLLYNDTEQGYSFTGSEGCQMVRALSGTFPRSAPRFPTIVPAGRTGWLKLWPQSDSVAFVGLSLVKNVNAREFRGGHNMHKLTLGTTSLTIPILKPTCQ